MYTLELTKEELDFIFERCSRKAARLEEANLKDIPCYRRAWQIIPKIFRAREKEEGSEVATNKIEEV